METALELLPCSSQRLLGQEQVKNHSVENDKPSGDGFLQHQEKPTMRETDSCIMIQL